MIRIEKLVKIFPGGTRAVNGVDLEVGKGEILALLGPNGAGKSTTIRCLTTLCGFDEGKIHVAGYDVDTHPNDVRKAIGLVAQQTGIDFFLTGRENLRLFGQLYHLDKKTIDSRIDELATYFELGDALDRTVMTYSGGMRRKLDIATALIHRPQLLLLDEPTLGLDIHARKNLWQYIRKLNQELNLTILLTTHYLEEADQLSHRVAIIANGTIRVVDTAEKLKQSLGGDAVCLSFPEVDVNTQTFSYNLKNLPGVKKALWDNNNLRIYLSDGAGRIPELLQQAQAQNVKIDAVTLSRPTLDDVFVQYTGSSLNAPSEESDGGEWWKQWAGKDGGKWAKKWQEQQSAETGESDAAQSTQWPNKEHQSEQAWPQDSQTTQGESGWQESGEQSWPKDSGWQQGQWSDKDWNKKE